MKTLYIAVFRNNSITLVPAPRGLSTLAGLGDTDNSTEDITHPLVSVSYSDLLNISLALSKAGLDCMIGGMSTLSPPMKCTDMDGKTKLVVVSISPLKMRMHSSIKPLVESILSTLLITPKSITHI